jgi:hypothetical protein
MWVPMELSKVGYPRSNNEAWMQSIVARTNSCAGKSQRQFGQLNGAFRQLPNACTELRILV